MNFTGTRTVPGFGSRINLNLVALAAGLALATAAAINLGAIGGSPAASTVPDRPAIAAPNSESQRADFILYVVDSQIQAETINATASQEEASLAEGRPLSATIRSYLVGGSTEADQRIQEQMAVMVAELAQASDQVSFKVVDLRE